MNLSRLMAYLALSVFVCSLSSCRGSNESQEGKKNGGQDATIRVAFVSNNNFGFWTYAERGCRKAEKELGVEVEFRRPSKGTLDEQKKMIENLMITGIQGLAISPNDPGNFVSFLKTQVSNKIPLVMADNDLSDTKARSCYIGTHNYRAGRAAGALVKKAIPKGGKIVIFVGRMDVPNAVERRQGLLDVLAGRDQQEMTERTPPGATDLAVGNCTLVATITDGPSELKCQKKAEEILLLHSDLACLIGLWEYNPPAILRAVQSSTSRPAIVGFDENFQTLEGIQKGAIAGTVVQNPFEFGYKSIKILVGLHKKDPNVFKGETIDAEKRIFIPHRVIVRNPGAEKIGNSETIDVDVFYPQIKKLMEEG